MSPDASQELSILVEKLKALQTLMHYERDFEKLKIYKRDLDLVSAELQRIEEALGKRQNSKVLPFSSKKPVRSTEHPHINSRA